MFILTLLVCSAARWTRSPNVDVHQEDLGIQNYKISDFEKQIVKFSGTYDVQLFMKDGINGFQNFSEFEEVKSQLQPACTFDQKRLNLQKGLWIDMTTSQNNFFSDIVMVKKFGYALMFSNDYKIYAARFNFTKTGDLQLLERVQENVSYEQYLDKVTDTYDVGSRVQAFYDQIRKSVYIVTERGGVHFSVDETGYKLNFMFNPFSINKPSRIELIANFLDTIYVVAGTEGVDIYTLGDKQLNFKTNLMLKDKSGPLDVVDLIATNKMIYVLDAFYGIHFIDPKTYDDTFMIPIQYAIAFSYHYGSFIVAAKTEQGIHFALEILYNENNGEYFYNRFYLDDLDVRGIYQFEDKSILIGYDAQRVVYQGIFKGFTDQEFDYESEFSETHVEHIEHVIDQDKKHLFVLTKTQLKTYRIHESDAQIVCLSDKEVQQTYWVKINSTMCAMKQQYNPFELCTLDYKFTIETFQLLLDSDQALPAEIILACVITGVLSLAACGLFLCRRWKRLLDILENQTIQLRQKKKYREMENLEGESNSNRDDNQIEQENPASQD